MKLIIYILILLQLTSQAISRPRKICNSKFNGFCSLPISSGTNLCDKQFVSCRKNQFIKR